MLNSQSFLSVDELLAFTNKSDTLEIHQFLQDWFASDQILRVQTSGSTGVPKTIELKKEFMVNSAIATSNYFKLPQKTTALLCLPIQYIAGKMMLIRALVLGWHLDAVEANSHPLKESSKKYDFCAMVPLQVENSLNELPYIKKVIVGGGVVSNQLQEKLQNRDCHVFATYGMTETSTHIAVKKLNNLDQFPSFYQLLPTIKIYKDDRNCLVIEAKKIAEKVLFTNDVVQLISEKEFDWLARFDNVINSGGVKLYPEVIENKLTKMIKNRFFVMGISDAVLGEKLILIIETLAQLKNQKKYQARLQDKLHKETRLSKFEIPKEIYFVKKIIETSSGKIRRKETFASLNL